MTSLSVFTDKKEYSNCTQHHYICYCYCNYEHQSTTQPQPPPPPPCNNNKKKCTIRLQLQHAFFITFSITVIYKEREKWRKSKCFFLPLRSENFYATATMKYNPQLQGSLYLIHNFYSQRISLRNPEDPTVTTEY
jgi:hypothetical protein